MALTVTTAALFTSLPNPKKPLTINLNKLQPICRHANPSFKSDQSIFLANTAALATTFLANLTTSPVALAAKQIAESPQQDNRSLALLLPVIPAIGWVLYNILGPALNQLNRMRSEKGIVFGLGLSGLLTAATGAAEAVESEEVSSGGGGNPGVLVLIVAAAVLLEVILLSNMLSAYESKKEGASE